MTENGIHYHVTDKQKLLIIAQKDGDTITYRLDLETAKRLRSELQRAVDDMENRVKHES